MRWKNNVLRRIHPSYVVFFIPLIILLAYGNQFLFLAGNEFSDLLISHLPNAIFLHRALFEWGQIPFWSPGILSGFPFAANPLSGLFYPPGWLAVLWPEAWMFNLVAGLHLVWGGIGLTVFLQNQGLSRLSALFGGLTFALMPKLLTHYGAGHISLVYAVSWTPWLLYSSFPNHDSRHVLHPRYWPALVLALIFFADVRWAAFAGVLWVGWWIKMQIAVSRHINWGRKLQPMDLGAKTFAVEQDRSVPHRFVWGKKLLSLAFHILIAAALSAPLAFPLMEFIRLSTRSTMGVADVLAFSLPSARLLGFLYPEMGGIQEWVVYPGILTLVLALIGGREVRRKMRFWWGVWLMAVIFSLGENIPGMSVLAKVPGVSLLRVPSRAMFIAGIALTISASFSLDDLLSGLKLLDRRRAMRIVVVLCGGSVALALGVWVLSGDLPLNFSWGAGMAGITLAGLGWMIGVRRPLPGWVGILLIGISVMDLGGVTVRSLSPLPAQEIVSEKADVMAFLTAQDGLFRVYSPSYSLPQHIAAQNGIELADGVDPMQIEKYSAFMMRASGVPQVGYSVTVPPFEGDVFAANAGYVPDAALLGKLNVRFVLAEFEVNAIGLAWVQQFGETRVYENALAQSRAWVETKNDIQVAQVVWSPNRIEVVATGPGRLVLSEMDYPGWEVWVDGQKAFLLNVNGLLRGVDLPAGSHQIIFAFYPKSLFIGLGLFGIAFGFLIISALRKQDVS